MDSTPDELARSLAEHSKHGKVEATMKEFAKGKLHSGSKQGPKVKDKSQALAIGLEQARKAGEDVPPKK